MPVLRHECQRGTLKRALRRWFSSLSAIVAVLTLALRIGASTSVFSLVNTILLKPPAGLRASIR